MRAYEFIRESDAESNSDIFTFEQAAKKAGYETPFPRKYNGSISVASLGCNSLKGCPEEVTGNLRLNSNALITLNGCAKKVGMVFSAYDCELVSLAGGPVKVGDDYIVSFNKITNLVGMPNTMPKNASIHADNCKLTTLEGLPEQCFELVVHMNFIDSLVGGPCRVYSNVFMSNNELTSLQGIEKLFPYIGSHLNVLGNPIERSISGLFKIQGLQTVSLENPHVEKIVNALLAETSLNSNQKIAKFTAELFGLSQKHNRPEWKNLTKP